MPVSSELYAWVRSERRCFQEPFKEFNIDGSKEVPGVAEALADRRESEVYTELCRNTPVV